jgi:hypothetical protein
MPGSGGGQFGAGIEQALGNHRHHQIAFPAGPGGNDGGQAPPADDPQDGLDVAVGKGLLGGEDFLGGRPGSRRARVVARFRSSEPANGRDWTDDGSEAGRLDPLRQPGIILVPNEAVKYLKAFQLQDLEWYAKELIWNE